MIQKIKILLLLNFVLVSTAFSKELPALFEIKIPDNQYTNTNDGLNKAFNQLIQKLSGSRSQQLLWRSGDAQLTKIEFLYSYSKAIIENQAFCIVTFQYDDIIQ